MSEASEETALDRVTDRLLADRLSPLWKRLGPLSTGAVGSALVVVAGTELVRRLVRMRKRRNLGLWGALALMPLVARALIGSETGSDEEAEERAERREGREDMSTHGE